MVDRFIYVCGCEDCQWDATIGEYCFISETPCDACGQRLTKVNFDRLLRIEAQAIVDAAERRIAGGFLDEQSEMERVLGLTWVDIPLPLHYPDDEHTRTFDELREVFGMWYMPNDTARFASRDDLDEG